MKFFIKKIAHICRRISGQAFVELAFIIVILLVIVLGAIDFGRMLSLSSRVASVARQSGRMLYAQNYDTNLLSNVFNIATNMIYPGDLQHQGKVIISYIMRVSGTDSNLTVTNNTNDVLIITNRFYYPCGASYTVPATNAPPWSSMLPTTFTNASGKFIPFTNNQLPVQLLMLQPYQTISYVEVFHSNNFLTTISNFGIQVPSYLYEASLF